MSPARRGRRAVQILVVLAACVALLGVAEWQTIAVRYLAREAMRDRRALLAYSRAPAGSLKHRAAAYAMETSAAARQALLEDYMIRAIPTEAHIRGLSAQDMAASIVWVRLGASSRAPRSIEHLSIDWSGFASTTAAEPFPGLLEQLEGRSLALDSHPGMTATVLRPMGELCVHIASEILRPEPEPLIQALSHESEAVRFYAARELAGHRAQAGRTAPHLALALRDPDSNVQHGARRSLWSLGAPGEAALIEEMQRADSPLRAAILEEVGDRSLELRFQGAQALLEIAEEPGATHTRHALRALERHGQAGGPEALARVARIAQDPARDVEARARACLTLAAMDREGAGTRQLLVELTKAPERAVAAGAYEALGRLGSSARALAEHVAGALVDPDPDVRIAAARALPRIVQGKEARFAEGVALLLRHEDPGVVLAALYALDGLGKPPAAAAPDLLRACHRQSILGRRAAVRLLGRLDIDLEQAREALELLEAALDEPGLVDEARLALDALRRAGAGAVAEGAGAETR